MCKNPKAQIYGVQKTSQSPKLKYTLQAREQCDNPGQRAGDVSSPWGLCLPPHHVLLLWLNAGGLCFFPFLCLFPFVCLPLFVCLWLFSCGFFRLFSSVSLLIIQVCFLLFASLYCFHAMQCLYTLFHALEITSACNRGPKFRTWNLGLPNLGIF